MTISLTLWAALAHAQAPATVAVTGMVTDAATGIPVAGAEVSCAGASAVTDEAGQFTVENVPPGRHTVQVNLIGYLPQVIEITAASTGPARIDVRLVSDPAYSEVIVIVGARTERTALQTPVPVDLITGETMRQGGQPETNQALSSVAPSFQASHQTIADGSDHVNPASMRGLNPDHVLVLVNGKRRHASALIHVTDSFGRGATGVDMNALPMSAVERIEVLRDGASAQYGSDAIAGVINVVLKDDPGTDATAMTGITGSGDGFTLRAGANQGVQLGRRGTFSLTGEFVRREPTNRARAWQGETFYGDEASYEETTQRLAENGLTRDDVRMKVGQSRATVGALMYNARLPVDKVELYSFGGFTYRFGDASGFYRRPEQEERVDPTVYPNGFLPEIHSRIADWAAAVGGSTEIGGWKLDVSANHGGNMFLFQVKNSVNASLGADGGAALGADDGGTSFDAGDLMFLQNNLNADVVKSIATRALRKLSVVGGAELRVESFRQRAGEEASWAAGTLTTSDGTPKVPGSQVFPGYQPDNEVFESRVSVGTYAGAESEISKRLLLDVAGRFEHYSDFGSTVTGKIAGRFDILDQLALRGAVSNGFRAPALHQVWYSATSTQFEVDPVTNMQEARQVLTTNNRSELAAAFGVPELTEETSINLSAGITARPLSNLSLTVDAYRVTIDDRIVLGSRLSEQQLPGVGALLAEFPAVSETEFFLNIADTETMGVDVVFDYLLGLAGGDLQLTAAANFMHNEVTSVEVPEQMMQNLGYDAADQELVRDALFSNQAYNRLEDLLPQRKGSLTARYRRGPLSTMTRARYYGPSHYAGFAPDGSEDEYMDDKVVFDLELGYRIADKLAIAVGADNLLNAFPDELQNPANRFYEQFIYRADQFGMNGGFYYLRLEYLR